MKFLSIKRGYLYYFVPCFFFGEKKEWTRRKRLKCRWLMTTNRYDCEHVMNILDLLKNLRLVVMKLHRTRKIKREDTLRGELYLFSKDENACGESFFPQGLQSKAMFMIHQTRSSDHAECSSFSSCHRVERAMATNIRVNPWRTSFFLGWWRMRKSRWESKNIHNHWDQSINLWRMSAENIRQMNWNHELSVLFFKMSFC